MARAYRSGQYAMAEIARYFEVNYATVSRAVRAFKDAAEELYEKNPTAGWADALAQACRKQAN